MKMIQVSEDALDKIKAMAEQDAKDAARYRWLREQFWGNGERLMCDVSRAGVDASIPYALDEAIDMQTK